MVYQKWSHVLLKWFTYLAFSYLESPCCTHRKTQIKYICFYYLAKDIWILAGQMHLCGVFHKCQGLLLAFSPLPLGGGSDLHSPRWLLEIQPWLSHPRQEEWGKVGRQAHSLSLRISRKSRCAFSLHLVGQNLVAVAHQTAREAGNIVFILCRHLLN